MLQLSGALGQSLPPKYQLSGWSEGLKVTICKTVLLLLLLLLSPEQVLGARLSLSALKNEVLDILANFVDSKGSLINKKKKRGN